MGVKLKNLKKEIKIRKSWGAMNPTTRIVKSKKVYSRKRGWKTD